MKKLLPILLFGLCGCSTTMPNFEQLAKQASEQNASFSLSADYKKKTFSLSRVNPPLGISATAASNAVQTVAPQGTALNISHVVHSISPNGVQTSTQQTPPAATPKPNP